MGVCSFQQRLSVSCLMDTKDLLKRRVCSTDVNVPGNTDVEYGVLQVTWVQPRVLTKPQIADLNSRLGHWLSKVAAGTQTLEAESLAVGA